MRPKTGDVVIVHRIRGRKIVVDEEATARMSGTSDRHHRANHDDILVEQALAVIDEETPNIVDATVAITKALDSVQPWMTNPMRRDIEAAVQHLDDALLRLWRITSRDE